MTPPPIAVFAYAFPHRKTQDFLTELAFGGYREVFVIAAPWRELPHADVTVHLSQRLRPAPAIDTRTVCEALGMVYVEAAHEDFATIGALVESAGLETGIIAGARILKREVIAMFEGGIVNIHPGILPQTAGLDVFYHTMRTGSRLGVTAHFIDHRVDAGRQIFFEETPLGPDDDVSGVQFNHYQTQIRALRRLIANPDWNALETVLIDRPRKNEPMTPEEKRAMLSRFPAWRNARHRQQQFERLLVACECGDVECVDQMVGTDPSLMDGRSSQGWTPLIVAAFHQQSDCVARLLSAGADPNAAGGKGTTALMYAKTAVLNDPHASRATLELLLDAGADVSRTDALGHDVVHYTRTAGDAALAEWLLRKAGGSDDRIY